MKHLFKQYFKQLILLLAVTFFSISTVSAAMISTQQVQAEISTGMMRDQISTALMREDVQKVLAGKGVDLQDALARVSAMTDQEVALVHDNIDSLPVGAGPGGVLVTVILVFVILDIIGVTNVFSFIHPAR